MTSSKIFLYFCLFFVGGIFFNSFLSVGYLAKAGLVIIGILFISVFWGRWKFVMFGFCILFLVLGIWRHQQVELKITDSELRKLNDFGEELILIGVVSGEPDIREKNIKLIINSEKLIINNQQKINGKILVTTNRHSEYQYGDRLKITGKLENPPVFEEFNYQDYLKKEGIYSIMSWPKIELIEKNQGNFIYAGILQFKNKLRESIYQNLSPPQSSILGAIILGDKREISEEWKEKLNVAGVRHITAISGLHVAILTTILMSFLLLLGFWRQQAFYFTIFLITFFIVMIGLQPSAIRAGIMGGLFLLSQYFGRLSVSSRAIVFAGTIMLAQNPLLLRFDVGFQLSFLAMFGIIYLLPAFKEWLTPLILKSKGTELKSILAMTLSAYLFTLPILIYNFGYVSLVAPITNILIIPFLYWIMIFGFISGIIGIVFGTLGWILSFPTWFLLTYLIKIVDLFSQPWAAKTFENVHWIWLIFSYLILGFIAWFINKKQRLKFLNY